MTIRTLDDVFDESPKVPPIIEVVTGARAQPLLEDEIKLDGSIYLGEYKPARPEAEEDLEYGECEDVYNMPEKYDPGEFNPLPGQYFENSKTLTTETRVRKYFETDGKELVDYLTEKGEKPYSRIGVSNQYIDSDAVAGVALTSDRAIIVAGTDFENKIDKMVDHYKSQGQKVDRDLIERYVWDHETKHIFQYGKDLDEVQAEYDVENTLKGFYTSMAEKADNLEDKAKYQTLAYIASDRADSVESNYSAAA